jgi:hypothetical protein
MKASTVVALAAWLSVLAALWGVFFGMALDWRFGVLVAGACLIGLVAGGLSGRYEERRK